MKNIPISRRRGLAFVIAVIITGAVFGCQMGEGLNGEFKKFRTHPSDYVGKSVSIDDFTFSAYDLNKNEKGNYAGAIDLMVVGAGHIGILVEDLSIDDRTREAMNNSLSHFSGTFECSDEEKCTSLISDEKVYTPSMSISESN